MKKAVVIVTLLVILFIVLNAFSIHYLGLPLSPVAITGNSITGDVSLYVGGNPKVVNVTSPTNTTYDFGIGDTYLVDVNATTDFLNDSWRYSLYDLKHGTFVEINTSFTPGNSIAMVRWGNRLTVEAHETDADWVSANDTFFTVNVPNSAPILGPIDSEILACENGSTLSYLFTVTDAEEGEDNNFLSYHIDPLNPFFIFFDSQISYNTTQLKIRSVILQEENLDFGTYETNISVKDNYNDTCCIDSNTTNITFIELNDAPVNDNGNIGAQTFWANAQNSLFYYEVNFTDDEDGVSSDGNLTFTLNWTNGEELFDINSTGVINYTNTSTVIGNNTYALELCVNDTALASPHQNISYCGDDGSVNEVCDTFTLTITEDNRAPVIDAYSPVNLNLSVSGSSITNFGVIVSDADGTIPDVDWYVDGTLEEHNELRPLDNYTHFFGCGVSGDHNLTVIVTDGLASVNKTWNVSVSYVACSVPDTGDDGGGGGSLSGICNEQWACNDWDVCQNAKRSFDSLALSPEDYTKTKDLCFQNRYDERFCGFQLTTCFDLTYCNNTIYRIPKPPESQVCYFTENPNCGDGITNCHDGGCELLVDCGGPCAACPTCSDGIQNQGELDVDCGGPCPYVCEVEKPFGFTSYLIILLAIILLMVLVFIIYKLIKIVRHWYFERKKSK